MCSILSPVLTESPESSEMAPQSSFNTATGYPGCHNSLATSVVFPAPELPVITTPRLSAPEPTDNAHPCNNNEPFSSCDLAGLKDVDSLGQLPGAPGAAAEFAQDVPGFQLGVGALAGGS